MNPESIQVTKTDDDGFPLEARVPNVVPSQYHYDNPPVHPPNVLKHLATIRVERPEGCERTALSIHAMDKHTRDLAWKTYLYADDKPLLCESFKLTERGTLMVEVKAECFEVK